MKPLRGIKSPSGVWALLLAPLLAFLIVPAHGHEPDSPGGIGVIEKTGQVLPADIAALDDRGREVRLADLLDRPAILSLVYYSCEHICPQVLVGLGKLVSGLDLEPGKDYRLITWSFDDGDTPAEAAAARKNYTLPLGPGFPDGGWAFLAASAAETAKLTGALGFSFKKDEHGFIHPVILIILAPGGRISRYVRISKFNYGVAYPIVFSPFETAESLRAAGRGMIHAGPGGPLLFCFPHEPPGQGRYHTWMTVLGSATLLGLAALFIYLASGRRLLREGR